MTTTLAYAVDSPQSKFQVLEITRRTLLEDDVKLDILYAGICHSDIHQARNEWKNSLYPMVPGHEILGRVVEVGAKVLYNLNIMTKQVTKFKVGDLAGIGCLVDSCRECKHCKNNEEQFCQNGFVGTYNSYEKDKKTLAQESFVIKVPNKFSKLEGVAPLLCAGITTYSPIHAHQSHVGPGKRVGIIGLGGLGHMGVKFAVAMGADVTVFSTSASKEADAKKLGAQHFVNTKNANSFASAGKFDFLLDTVSAKHEIAPFIGILDVKGVLAIVGNYVDDIFLSLRCSSRTLHSFSESAMLIPQGSLIGGIKETQEMINFCAQHDITSDVEIIKMEQVEEAYERTIKSDVKYRFVIDITAFGK